MSCKAGCDGEPSIASYPYEQTSPPDGLQHTLSPSSVPSHWQCIEQALLRRKPMNQRSIFVLVSPRPKLRGLASWGLL